MLLVQYQPSNNRSQIKKSERGNYLILDAYNANPSSMNLAVDELLLYKGNKLFILGDMKELGSVSEEEHIKVIKKIHNAGCKAIFIGQEFLKYSNTIYPFFESVDQLIESSKLESVYNCKILIKGSRSVKLEKLESYL
jgi:UDP-N-acetylmuramyl pentapeptide synthase